MMGDFITRCLLLLFGYAYPAFECYKTMVNSRIEIQELRFWCQYWIIVAILTVLERVGDIFLSWLPMYGEMKLAFFIYLWYPKTKGSGYVFDTLLKPYVTKHETDIEVKLKEWRLRAWDLAVFYMKNCSELGKSAFFDVVQYLASQSTKSKNPTTKGPEKEEGSKPAPPPPPNDWPSFYRKQGRNSHQSSRNKRYPLSAPPLPRTEIHRSVSGTQQSDAIRVQLHDQTEHYSTEEAEPRNNNQARFFRRFKPYR